MSEVRRPAVIAVVVTCRSMRTLEPVTEAARRRQPREA